MDYSSYDNDNRTADGDPSAIIATTIRETLSVRLKSVIGLHTINDGWLVACVRYLQQRSGSAGGRRGGSGSGSGGKSGSQDDDILYQILHSDLRDVIRGGCSTTSSSGSGIPPLILPVEVRQLQDGISKSSSSSRRRQQRSSSSSSSNNNSIDNIKPLVVVLPQNFRLLCQIEEVVDMSQPSERRLLGSSSASSQQQQQQQPRGGRPYYNNNNNNNNQPLGGGGRCLKICLVHGYKINDMTMDDDPHPLLDVVIGMESASPIPGLAPGLGGTKAGTKVLLKGPIEIRDRMLLLHSGNCIVLGGCIPWYTWRQRSALINAKNMAGVGVDPTVRALIGTNPIDAATSGGAGDDDENNDEGHESSSSDYHPHHRPTHPAATSSVQAHAPYQSFFATGQRNSTMSSLSSSTSPSSSMTPPQQQNNRSAWAHSSSTTQGSRQQPRPQPPPRQAPARTNPDSSDSSSRRKGAVVNNPYSNVSGHAPSSSSSVVASSSSSRSPIPPPASNPYARHRSQSQPQPSQHGQSRITPPSIRQGNISSAATNRDVSIDRTKNYKDLHSRPTDVENRPPSKTSQRDIISSVSPASTHVAGAAAGSSGDGVGTASTIHQATPTIPSFTIKSATSSPSSSIQVMSFESLHTLLSQLLGDREMYQSYHQQEELSFKVRLVAQTSGSRIVFNVDKVKKDKSSKDESKKKKKKKDGKKYEYRVVTTFGDGDRPESSPSLSSSKFIACKIDPMMVEPHFPVSPGELRSLNRADRAECDRVTKQGEASIKAAFFLNPRVWTAKLLPSAEELFGPSGEFTPKSVDDRLQDVQMPVLLLQ